MSRLAAFADRDSIFLPSRDRANVFVVNVLDLGRLTRLDGAGDWPNGSAFPPFRSAILTRSFEK